ncbi:uncharacterized protein LOC121386086 [Gigantopelta aegis]|uniref:uncharacterized protein LOC121372968 n=1 Tax=Gigantopelta aegis TaxID=1735272 RepID=UPI001B888DF9|nr:uncharacterized protein LOC121372968 [Gigantopelta aegis]XP_041372820.1 uncharacterized protein LOC121386086 [Gigantopelta aegis]
MAPKAKTKGFNETEKNVLEKYYSKPRGAGAFYGPKKFHSALKRRGLKTYKLRTVTQWLNDKDAYSLHKPVSRSFRRLRVRVNKKDEMFDMDLMDVSRHSKVNNGIRYLLIVIDILSRYAWAIPLVNKKPETVLEGFKTVLKDGRIPKKVRVDKGTEFAGLFKQFLLKENIKLIVTQNEDIKSNFAERFIRTIRSLLARYTTYNNTQKYIDVLEDLVHNYNNTVHSSLGQWAPADVNKANEIKVWSHQYVEPMVKKLKVKKPLAKFVFKVGDLTRISYLRKSFTKEQDLRWTEELFKIHSRSRRQGIPIYRLRDFHDEVLKGIFYTSELQKVNKNQDILWKIEKVLKKKKEKGKVYYLVRWLGWPPSFDSYVEEGELKTA